MSIDIRDAMRRDLRAAMRERDARRVSTLRTLIAAIDNAEAVPLPENPLQTRTRAVSQHIAVTGHGPSEAERRLLSEADVSAIIRAEAEALQSAAADFRTHGALAAAEDCAAKAAIALSYV
jgi:uncharacterized protein